MVVESMMSTGTILRRREGVSRDIHLLLFLHLSLPDDDHDGD